MYQIVVITIGLFFLLFTSGRVVRATFNKIGINMPTASEQDLLYGKIFGKCENVIIFTMILLGGYTALALIFAGKTIVRSEDKEKVSVFHLAGTMINTAYSILIAFIVKLLIGKISAFS